MARQWFCVQAQHGRSTGVKMILESQGFRVFQPMELVEGKRNALLKPLLGDYLFVLFDRLNDNWKRILGVRNVLCILGLTKFRPSAVSNRNIRIFMALCASYDTIDVGDLVKVIRDDRHEGKLGIAQYADGERVALALLDDRSTMFSFSRQNVKLTKWTKYDAKSNTQAQSGEEGKEGLRYTAAPKVVRRERLKARPAPCAESRARAA